MTTAALSGIRVLDATHALAGPLCTMVLGDLGADVIKLEMPGVGDETRHWGPPFAGDAGPTFVGFNRNKRSVAIDLHTAEGRETCLALARTSDVFVENFRPGTVERFQLSYEIMRRVRPDIVYCSISGFGQSGPMAHRPALDLMVQAASGLMSLTGEQDGRPMKAAAPVADVMGGFSAVVAIMAALMQRQHTGEGRYLDISMLDGLIALMGQAVAIVGMSGKAPRRTGNAHPLASPYESFRCADRDIVIAVTNEKAWASFCRLPEFARFARDPRYTTQPLRSANRDSPTTGGRFDFPEQTGSPLAGGIGEVWDPGRADQYAGRNHGAPTAGVAQHADQRGIPAGVGQRRANSRHAVARRRGARHAEVSARARPA